MNERFFGTKVSGAAASARPRRRILAAIFAWLRRQCVEIAEGAERNAGVFYLAVRAWGGPWQK